MGVSARPRKKYRPKAVNPGAHQWVVQGVQPVRYMSLCLDHKVKNASAFDDIRAGRAEPWHMGRLVAALKIAGCLTFVRDSLGADWRDAIRAGLDALMAASARGDELGRYVLTGPELTALGVAVEIHGQQLDECTLDELERAIRATFQ